MQTISKKEERQIRMNTKVFSQWNMEVHLCHNGIITSQGQRELFPFSHESQAMNLHGIKYRIVDILSLIDVKHHKEESGEQRERAAERTVSSRPLCWPMRKTEAKACIFPAVIMKTFSHDLFLPLDRNSSLKIARRGPKMTRKDKEGRRKMC